jgi:DDE superfamily endonuclease
MRRKALTGCGSDRVAGESPLFPPQHATDAAAKEEVRDVVAREPGLFGFGRARWTLDLIRHACPWLSGLTRSGVHGLLDRLGVVWKRGQAHVHSPDRLYLEKRADIAEICGRVGGASGEVVLIYQDEVTIYRQPTLGFAYGPRGAEQPLAERSHAADTQTRYVAGLDHGAGRVIFRRSSRTTIKELVQFYRDLRAAYPEARVIYVALDNWPVHFHPDLLVALQPQARGHLFRTPPNWPTGPSAGARAKWGDLALPIQLVPLPTYASWLNPIEKLWRWLKQEVVHHHRLAHDLATFRRKMDEFLRQFAGPSPRLLQYVGLGLPE